MTAVITPPITPPDAYWQKVLTTGGATVLPRWTTNPVPGAAEHAAPIPADVVAALPGALPTAVLAAHAAVLAVLTGEPEVVVGYGDLPLLLTTAPETWRALVDETRRAEAQLRAHAGTVPDDSRGPSFDTVVGDGDAAPLQITVDGTVLRLRYRTDVLDAAAAARIAGYHLTALARIAAEPDAPHRGRSLLSADELRFQLDGLAGPPRALPDHRVHELFEQRVAVHPDRVAAEHRGRTWTYAELNARANRLGRALQARGLPRESVVAVVTERNLDWFAAVLGIWKAGLTYLPLEPHFPAVRIATALTRAECRVVLTEAGSTSSLDPAPAGVELLLVDDAYAEGHGDENLGVAVAADQLAYVLFTSGSTGEPKGAMCEHAGMLNHIVAKLDDLAVAEGEVIPQTGPQCFDISVWQLVGALLVGGRTLLVEQEAILDAARFVDTIVAGRAAVLQVVPSYLDVLLAYLEQHPRELPDLHTVCPTGDLLKKELVQRWCAAQPGIPMVNTYGLTETSDDAVHAVLHEPPAGDRVPLGRPIINTHVDVVDENHVPVPLGAPGLIVFSGVCVGRGYINDPERTARVFGPDPLRPGQRICRTGDHGRWRPDGTLDFLGRRDNQIKIRGFRIEVGEIENALLRLPGVRDAAVVVGGAQLVGFYASPEPLDGVPARLAEVLPDYMVPTVVRWQPALPLTPNGKIDRTALTGLATVADQGEPPATPTERWLAGAWASVLGVPGDRVGRHDDFFDSGGTSLSAVKLAIALDRRVSLKDITRHPVLADLARFIGTT